MLLSTFCLRIIGAIHETHVHGCSALKRTGQCLFNGQPLTKKLKRQVGYVMQARPPTLAGKSGSQTPSSEPTVDVSFASLSDCHMLAG